MHAFFATCPKLLEGLLEDELRQLGATELKQTVAGVYFNGPLSIAYKACLWSRLANRVLLTLASFPIDSNEALYDGCYAIDWSAHLSADHSLCVDFNGQTTFITNTQFGAQKVKDALVDKLRQQTGSRPNIDKKAPDIRINVYLHHQQLTVSLDLSGHSLHQRGYRLAAGVAPLKENVAAAVLLRAQWPRIAAENGVLLDPFCGSGTFLIEGAMLAANIAPGLYATSYGFERWLGHDPASWTHLWQEAQELREAGLIKGISEIHGYDADPRMIGVAKENIERAGLTDFIRVSVKDVSHFTPPTHKKLQPGLIVANPPYGERMGDITSLVPLYRQLGRTLREQFVGWEVALLTGNPDLGKTMGLRAHKQHALFNGPIACKLLRLTVQEQWFVNNDKKPLQAPTTNSEIIAPWELKIPTRTHIPPTQEQEPDITLQPLTPGAQMIYNRLQKNIKHLANWRKSQHIYCYRVYDADMPEYSAAIDYYQDANTALEWLHVQEYAAPASIEEEKTEQRWQELLSAVQQVLHVPITRLITKERRRQKGLAQYEKQDQQQQFITVQEGAGQFLINLTDYLDTGLFLDSRLIRQRIASYTKNKQFLNLYCYTASATVHALKAGANFAISVDLSRTYTQWAERNLAHNGFSAQRHPIIQADCWQWLEENDHIFEVILLDPPTFSNSKKMQNTLDIQRDHAELIHKTMNHLAKDGVMIFCTNSRQFKLDEKALTVYQLTDITPQTIDKDFQRNKRIHHCWEIRHHGLSS